MPKESVTKCDENNSLNESPPNVESDVDSLVRSVHFQRLFRLFLLFSDNQLFWHCPGGRLLRFVRLTQAQFILCQMCQIRDQLQILPTRLLPSIHSEEDAQLGIGDGQHEVGAVQAVEVDEEEFVTFHSLLQQIGQLFPLRRHFEPIVDRLFGRYVLQLIRKGFLFGRQIVYWPKHSHISPSDKFLWWQQKKRKTFASFCHPLRRKIKWHTFWCVLMPGQLHLWRQKKEQKNHWENPNNSTGKVTLQLQRNAFVKYAREDGNCENVKELFGWQLVTGEGIFEFAHFDQLQRQFWIADIELAIRKRSPSLLCQFDRANSLRKIPEKNLLKKLESEKRELAKELEMEKDALGDEEKIRQMATRMLDEEISKGEKLQRKVRLLEHKLKTEKSQKKGAMEHRDIEEEQQRDQRKNNADHHHHHHEEGDDQQQREDSTTARRPRATIRPITPIGRTKRSKRLKDELERRKEQEKEEDETEQYNQQQKTRRKMSENVRVGKGQMPSTKKTRNNLMRRSV